MRNVKWTDYPLSSMRHGRRRSRVVGKEKRRKMNRAALYGTVPVRTVTTFHSVESRCSGRRQKVQSRIGIKSRLEYLCGVPVAEQTKWQPPEEWKNSDDY